VKFGQIVGQNSPFLLKTGILFISGNFHFHRPSLSAGAKKGQPWLPFTYIVSFG
jgi:hypothetical protein